MLLQSEMGINVGYLKYSFLKCRFIQVCSCWDYGIICRLLHKLCSWSLRCHSEAVSLQFRLYVQRVTTVSLRILHVDNVHAQGCYGLRYNVKVVLLNCFIKQMIRLVSKYSDEITDHKEESKLLCSPRRNVAPYATPFSSLGLWKALLLALISCSGSIFQFELLERILCCNIWSEWPSISKLPFVHLSGNLIRNW